MTLVVLLSGCAQLRLPAIDPSGQRIFLPQTDTQVVGPFSSPEAVFPSATALPAPGTCNPPQPYGWSPLTGPGAPAAQPNGLCSLFPGWGNQNSLTTAVGGPPSAPPQPLLPVPDYGGGLAQPPVPQPIASNRNFLVGSGSPRPGYDGTFTITPSRMVAPVGSTVILRAGICDEDGFLVMRQPIEWSLSPDSVGSIVDVDNTAKPLWRHLFRRPPKKESGHYAIGLTSTVPQLLDRGNTDPNDDIWLMRGQTWMSVTSGSEGATNVTSVAPAVNGWEERQETATIYWVDGQWRLPPPAMSGYGGHTLVTNVARTTTGEPVQGWLVRYEVLGGTPAALDPNGAQILEVPTDLAGNAAVAVIPTGGGQGVTTVGVQVIRPGLGTASASRIKIGEGTTTITWTDQAGPGPSLPGPSLPSDGGFSEPDDLPGLPLPPLDPPQQPGSGQPFISMDVRGPVVAEVGAEVEYQFVVTNTGNIGVEAVEIGNEVPAGLQYLQSSPAAGEFGDRLRWELGSLQPGQSQTVRVLYRANRAGVLQNCAGAIGDGATSDDCATTDIQGQSLSLQLNGPQSVNVNDAVEYEILLKNESNRPVSNVLLRAAFDPGLEHPFGTSPLEWPIGRLESNETKRLPLNFTARQTGQLCTEVTVVSERSGTASDRSCVNVGGVGGGNDPGLPPFDNGPGVPPVNPGPTTPPPSLPPSTPTVRVRKTGPSRSRVGDVVEFFITVETGNLPATNFQLVDEFDLALEPVQAMNGPGGEPFDRDGNRLFWQIAYMPAGKSETFQVNCRCIAPSQRACNKAIVISNNGQTEESQTCLEITDNAPVGATDGSLPPLPDSNPPIGQPSLNLDVRRMGPSIQGNGLIEYVVEVTNRSDRVDRNVTLAIETPDGSRYFDSHSPPRIEPFRTTPDGRQVEFPPISTLRPGETMSFRILVQQQQSEIGTFVARVKSDLNPASVTSDDQS